MERLFIPGNAGKLEATLDLPEGVSQCVVVCHPHPQYGGSMNDHVVSNMASAVRACGIGAVRFNFRGVGGSEGNHDKGKGEVDDLVSIVNYLQQERRVQSIVVAGYSFGAVIALNGIENTGAVKAILVAPPVNMMETCELPDIPIQVILGEFDDIVSVSQTAKFFNLSKVSVIEGANHFFAEADTEINNLITEFISGA